MLDEFARRNWIILGLLVFLSLFWQSRAVTLGVASGGLTAIAGFLWLQRSLRKVMAGPSKAAARSFQINYFIRLGALLATLFLLIRVVEINFIGLGIGLSLVVINLFVTTLLRMFQRGGSNRP